MKPFGGLWRREPGVYHLRMGGCSGCSEMVDSMLRDGARTARPAECSSPRHADAVIVTGLWTPQLAGPALKVISQAPRPIRLLVVGECALGGGLTAAWTKWDESVLSHLEADLQIAGCPVEPVAVLEGVRRVSG